jgi:hypothetical protein
MPPGLMSTHAILFDRFAAAIDRQDDMAAVLLNRELVRNRDRILAPHAVFELLIASGKS